MKIHRNLLWLQGDPALLDQLVADRALASLVVTRPAPDTCAFQKKDHQRLMTRLAKLGHTPKVSGRW